MAKMGMQFGLEGDGRFCKRKFRWMFVIPSVSGDESTPNGMDVLPPEVSARPNIQFKEMSVHHLHEDVYYPAKPDWKPIKITLFDLKSRGDHPVFHWINEIYDPRSGIFKTPNANPIDPINSNTTPGLDKGFIKNCSLNMLNGCGDVVERWVYEDAWPQSVDFQTLDMNDSQIMKCDITLRYARAYII